MQTPDPTEPLAKPRLEIRENYTPLLFGTAQEWMDRVQQGYIRHRNGQLIRETEAKAMVQSFIANGWVHQEDEAETAHFRLNLEDLEDPFVNDLTVIDLPLNDVQKSKELNQLNQKEKFE